MYGNIVIEPGFAVYNRDISFNNVVTNRETRIIIITYKLCLQQSKYKQHMSR